MVERMRDHSGHVMWQIKRHSGVIGQKKKKKKNYGVTFCFQKTTEMSEPITGGWCDNVN